MTNTALTFVKDFTNGQLFNAQGIPVVKLKGNHYEMGCQYGHLLSANLKELYHLAVEEYFLHEVKLPLAKMQGLARLLYSFYPQRHKEFFHGMAQTSGLTLEQHLILNGIEYYGVLPGCSSIACTSPYTTEGQLVFGRCYDWFDYFASYEKFLTVTIMHAEHSTIPCAFVSLAGLFYLTTGINKAGLFVELNMGMTPSKPKEFKLEQIPTVFLLLSMLEDYGTMAQMDTFMQTFRASFSYLVSIANANEANLYECTPKVTRKRSLENGLLVASNHFLDPKWSTGYKQDRAETHRRYANLQNLAGEHKGKIDLAKMQSLLAAKIAEGGPSWPHDTKWQTLYRVIAQPGKQELSINTVRRPQWVNVSLAELFAK